MRPTLLPVLIFASLLALPSQSQAGSTDITQCLVDSLTKQGEFKTGRKIKLFKKGEPVKNYSSRVEKLRPGDWMDFGDGHVFRFVSELSSKDRGDLTQVIDIGDGKALRISRHFDQTLHTTPEEMKQQMLDYYELMDELEKNGVPTVQVFRKESHPPFYIVVSKEDFRDKGFRLVDLFQNGKFNPTSSNPKLAKIDPQVIESAVASLPDFAEKTWMYSQIGDFRFEQLGYNGKEWLIFDTGKKGYTRLENLRSKRSSFSSASEDPGSGAGPRGNKLPKTMVDEITRRIVAKRTEALSTGPWIEREEHTHVLSGQNYLFRGAIREPLEPGTVFRIKSGNPELRHAGSGLKDWWVEKKVKFAIVKPLPAQDRTYSHYEIKLKDGSTALLKVLRWNSPEDLAQVAAEVAALKETKQSRKNLIGWGKDFLIVR